ncbi:MAG: type IV toxin-antitoxin system AbiEi family antitoxin domain-containing protein [Acidimicrobiales bacterium]
MPLTPDPRADRFAARHHGLITRAAALEAGLTRRQVDRRLLCGRWLLVGRGVYRVASATVTWQQRSLAACLAGSSGTVASHLTAAALHGLWTPPAKPHVIAGRLARGRSRLAIVHRIDLKGRDAQTIQGVPCTTATRTLIDCAGLLSYARLCDVIDDAFCQGLSHPIAVGNAIYGRRPVRGKTGIARLRIALQAWTPGIEPGSRPEMRLLRQILDWGFAAPESQIEIVDDGGMYVGRIDLGWPTRKVGVEYDGDRHHNPRGWDRDEDRQVQYKASGWDVRRVDKYDLRPGVAWLREFLAEHLGRAAA